MNKDDIDRALRELGIAGGIDGFRAEAAEWAKKAKQCKECRAWAILDIEGYCFHCQT